MKILSRQLKPLFIEAAKKAFPELTYDQLEEAITIEFPKNADHGDYACPSALRLAKIVGSAPLKVAEQIAGNLSKDIRIESVEVAAPGFINIRVGNAFLQDELKELESGFRVQRDVEPKKVIIEYSSTNAAKQMGVHHLITTILGQALANLFEFMGEEVIKINHLGDWGTHFGKIIYAYENWGDKDAVQKNPNVELVKLYVRFNEEAEKNPELDEEARKVFKSLEEGDAGRMALWQWIVNESVKDQEKMFRRLLVDFDYVTGESFYLKMAEQVIEDGLKKGLFVEGEGGSLIFNMGEGQTPALIRKGDGTTLYLTRDIATVKYRVDNFRPNEILYVVDVAQSLHFVQDFTVAKALGYADGVNLEHISFGRMAFADGAISTRKGNVIVMEQVLDEAAKRAEALAKERGTEMSEEEFKNLSEIVGISSIKYGILSQDRIKNLIFDWDKMITLEGNSAPYLLYSFARAKSILDKAGEPPLDGLPKLSEQVEFDVVRQMVKFPEVLENAMDERKPHIISTYLFDLCHKFNRFYSVVQVLNAEESERRTRLGIVRAFLHQLKAGLSILGIPVLDRM